MRPDLYTPREIETRVYVGQINGRKSQKMADAATRHTVADGTVAGKKGQVAHRTLRERGARAALLDIHLPQQSPALLQLLLNLLPVLTQPFEPGAALQIGAGAAQLVAPLPGADPDGAVGRAAAIPASGTAGVGGHPVQGLIYRGPVYGLPAGHKGGPHGDLAVGDVLAGLARALRRRATAQGTGIAEDATGAELALGRIWKFGHEKEILRLKIFIGSFKQRLMVSPLDTKGDQAGIWQSRYARGCWPRRSLRAAAKGAEPQRMPQGASWDLCRVKGSVLQG